MGPLGPPLALGDSLTSRFGCPNFSSIKWWIRGPGCGPRPPYVFPKLPGGCCVLSLWVIILSWQVSRGLERAGPRDTGSQRGYELKGSV